MTGGSDDAPLTLRQRYDALAARYYALAQRHRDRLVAEDELHTVARGLVRTGHIALARIQDGQVVWSNPRWHALDRGAVGLGKWRLRAEGNSPGEKRLTRLTEVVLAAAGTLRKEGQNTRVFRCDVVPAGPTVEVMLEHDTAAGRDRVFVAARDVTTEVAAERRLEAAREGLAAAERGRIRAGACARP